LEQPNVDAPKKEDAKLTSLAGDVWKELKAKKEGWYYKKGKSSIDWVYCFRPAGKRLVEGVTKFSGSEALATQYEKDGGTILYIMDRAKKAVIDLDTQTSGPTVTIEQPSGSTAEDFVAPVLVTPAAAKSESGVLETQLANAGATPMNRILAIEREFGLAATIQGLNPRLIRLEEYLLGESGHGSIFARLPPLEKLAGLE
jgi:hypothetical protein